MRVYSLCFCVSFLLFSFSTMLQAQEDIVKSIEKQEPGRGKVRIFQDPAIAKFIGQEWDDSQGEQGVFKVSGFRVQVYAGNNSRESKAEAQRLASKVKELHPEMSVYTRFASPRWICRVGDFRSIEEADALMRQLRRTGQFREVSIVKEQIIITL